MNVIEATGLGKHYGEVAAVAGIDLTVAEGEVVAVLGPNGAGKTTTIEMLLGLRSPTAGEVRVFGAHPASAEARGRVGAMLQDTDAPESLTVTEMIDLVGCYYPYRLPTAEVLERADLQRQAQQRVTQLSGGLRQRLSFALSIAGDPDLLYLDEPTAALDVQARRAFWEQVDGFAALGKTILFSTHNLAEADAVADRIVVISAGTVVQDGSPQQVKHLVAGRTITLVTDAADAELQLLTGVRAVLMTEQQGELPAGTRRLQLQVVEAEPPLRELFIRGHLIQDLTVHEATLEDAFVHLTRKEAVS